MQNDIYRTDNIHVSRLTKRYATFNFYRRMLPRLWAASRAARKGCFDRRRCIDDTLFVIKALESVGVKFEIENPHVPVNNKAPCVFVSNHMRTLETFILPSIVGEGHSVTFVIWGGLLKYPLFREVVRSMEPIVLNNHSPRENYKKILREGKDRLERGMSVVIFPEGRRNIQFNASNFSQIGTRLASHAGVPVIPVALKTDAWAYKGFPIGYFGRIDTRKSVRFSFGNPLHVNGNGREEHRQVVDFISEKLQLWASKQDGIYIDTGL